MLYQQFFFFLLCVTVVLVCAGVLLRNMKLLILLGVLTYSIVANGLLNCENATIDFQTNNFDCYVAFLNAAVQTLSGGMVDNDTIELLCVNETCRTDLMHYAAACQSNETVSECEVQCYT